MITPGKPGADIRHGAVRDPEAFAILYDRHAATLHRYAARRLGESAADDIVADTFLAATLKRDRHLFATPPSFAAELPSFIAAQPGVRQVNIVAFINDQL